MNPSCPCSVSHTHSVGLSLPQAAAVAGVSTCLLLQSHQLPFHQSPCLSGATGYPQPNALASSKQRKCKCHHQSPVKAVSSPSPSTCMLVWSHPSPVSVSASSERHKISNQGHCATTSHHLRRYQVCCPPICSSRATQTCLHQLEAMQVHHQSPVTRAFVPPPGLCANPPEILLAYFFLLSGIILSYLLMVSVFFIKVFFTHILLPYTFFSFCFFLQTVFWFFKVGRGVSLAAYTHLVCICLHVYIDLFRSVLLFTFYSYEQYRYVFISSCTLPFIHMSNTEKS